MAAASQDPHHLRQENRSLGQKCVSVFCRTWMRELLFTFMPCAVMVLIIALLYTWQEQTKEVSRELFYEHSFPPMVHALRQYINQRARFINYLKETIEGGGMIDTLDEEEVLKHIVPFMVKGVDSHGGAGFLLDETYIVYDSGVGWYFTNWATNYMVSAYQTTYNIAPDVVYTRTRNINALNYLHRGDSWGAFHHPETVVDRANARVEFPWSSSIDGITFASTTGVPIYAQVTAKLAPDEQTTQPHIGFRFESEWAPEVKTGGFVQPPFSSFFVTLSAEAVMNVIPACQATIQALVFDTLGSILAYNCLDPTLRVVKNYPSLSEIHDLIIRPYEMLSNGTLIQMTKLNIVSGVTGQNYYFASLSKLGPDWQGHNPTAAAINAFAAQMVLVTESLRDMTRRLDSSINLEQLERTIIPILRTHGSISKIVHRLPTRITLSEVHVYRLEGISAVTSIHIQSTTQLIQEENVFAAYSLTCDSAELARTTHVGSACAQRTLLQNGSVSFYHGFDEVVQNLQYSNTTDPRTQSWIQDAIIATAQGKMTSDGLIVHPNTLQFGLVTFIQVATLPSWTYLVNPASPRKAFIRTSFSVLALQNMMDKVMGEYAQKGKMLLVDDSFRAIAGTGTRFFNNVPIDFTSLTMAQFTIMKVIFSYRCARSTNGVLCDTNTQQVISVSTQVSVSATLSHEYTVMRLAKFGDDEPEGRPITSWWLVVSMPTEILSVVTTTDQVEAIGFIIVCVLLLIINVAYVIFSTLSIIDLKRFLRLVATGNSGKIGKIRRSWNNEIREIESSVLKARDASIEFSKFLPKCVDRDATKMSIGISDSLYRIDGEFGLVDAPVEREGAPVAAAGKARAVAEDDEEMRPPQDAPRLAASKQPTNDPSVLITQDIRLDPRDITLVSATILDHRTLFASLTATNMSTLTSRLSEEFGRHAKRFDGILLPSNSPEVLHCAFPAWERSNKPISKALQMMHVASSGFARSNEVFFAKNLYPRFTLLFTCTSGRSIMGNVGSYDRKSVVIQGKPFDMRRQLITAIMERYPLTLEHSSLPVIALSDNMSITAAPNYLLSVPILEGRMHCVIGRAENENVANYVRRLKQGPAELVADARRVCDTPLLPARLIHPIFDDPQQQQPVASPKAERAEAAEAVATV